MKKIIYLISISLVVLNASAPKNAADEAAQLEQAMAASLASSREDKQLAEAIAASKKTEILEKGTRLAIADIKKKDAVEKLTLLVGFSGDDCIYRSIYNDISSFSLGHGPFLKTQCGYGKHIYLNWNAGKDHVSPQMQNVADEVSGRFQTIVIDLITIHHAQARVDFFKCLSLMLKPGGRLYIPQEFSTPYIYGIRARLRNQNVSEDDMDAEIQKAVQKMIDDRMGNSHEAMVLAGLGLGMDKIAVPFSQPDDVLNCEDKALRIVYSHPRMEMWKEKISQHQPSELQFIKYTKPA